MAILTNKFTNIHIVYLYSIKNYKYLHFPSFQFSILIINDRYVDDYNTTKQNKIKKNPESSTYLIILLILVPFSFKKKKLLILIHFYL